MNVSAAKYYCKYHKTDHEVSWYHKAYAGFASVVYENSLFSDGALDSGGNPYFNVEKLLRFDVSGDFKSIWNAGESIYKTLLPVGLILVVVYFLLELFEKVLQDSFSAEHLAKSFIKLALMLLFLMNGYELITAAMDIVSAMFNTLMDPSVFKETVSPMCYIEMVSDSKTGAVLGMISVIIQMALLLFPYLIMLLAKLVVRIIIWVRIMNIVIYTMFAPIGMADMVKGTESSGFRYFKKLISFSLQGVIIYGITTGYKLVSNIIIKTSVNSLNGLYGFISTMVLAFVVITLMFRSANLASEVMGA